MPSPVFTFIGPDSATHMAEEIKDASITLPRAMIIMPFVQTFSIATEPHIGTSVMTAILITLTTFGCITNVATASRQMFAFARDKKLPFSTSLAHVHPGWDVPLNAIAVSYCITILLSFINIDSTVAFNAIASLGTAALISSYIISITCVAIKRCCGEKLPPSRWSLGQFGGPINMLAVL
ncbi:uncharacterized protein LMH87_008002 [Akanthomyces muscarius]|uniref:Amino acid permease n=1 Tax=Akanthomyces muscarius TaxID=2231603 RepID=A0A9W8QMQ8_AKAMU|nr:uncharacterized protein LMH87_008002 [Akanthomyces muscarius]KAJ4160072.1 hypothetical protein LMH87_008002 [Akanthomyces muscarius]